MTDGPKFPNVTVKMIGESGNAFSILGRVRNALKDGGASSAERDAFMREAQSGDYNDLLLTVQRWVQVD